MSEQVETVRRYLTALTKLDAAAMADELADDVVLVLPYAPEGMPARVEGKSKLVAFLEPVLGGLWKEIEFPTLEVRGEQDPEYVVAEYTSVGTFANGQPYRQTYVNLCRVHNGKIVETKEFFDPNALLPGLAPAEGA